uniref:Uncharacterized protein n=1 Tax=Arundo donax TaxID=35708 RepID=A0A0A9CBB6_ARUDO
MAPTFLPLLAGNRSNHLAIPLKTKISEDFLLQQSVGKKNATLF